jgi:1-hydroxycarotenoid 3,4-desaturase
MARSEQVVVLGGGVGGLAAALALGARGMQVTVVEKEPQLGGKLRQQLVGRHPVDVGPTVVTMRWVLEQLFLEAGQSMDKMIILQPLHRLARHFWPGGASLDLFSSVEESVAAVSAFAGDGDGVGLRRFLARAERIHEVVSGPFMYAAKPSLADMVRVMRAQKVKGPWELDLHCSMWRSYGRYFSDQRLWQLFGRYATYYGSSPFQAPALLNLIAHVESTGVAVIEGGMYRLVEALRQLILRQGGQVRCGVAVQEILVDSARVVGVRLADGQCLSASTVVCNADLGALAQGRLGPAAQGVVRPLPLRKRSLSAVTFACLARPQGVPLVHHNIFFSQDYPREFRQLSHGVQPEEPTVYICAQDRGDDGLGPEGPERLLCLVNAPALGDRAPLTDLELQQCEEQIRVLLKRCGLTLNIESPGPQVTAPQDFEQLFPGSGGALYGRATQGVMTSFQRPGARTKLRGLYLVGGGVHPGAGVPMAAWSGLLAAQAIGDDLGLTWRWRPMATPGGTLTPSATMEPRA